MLGTPLLVLQDELVSRPWVAGRERVPGWQESSFMHAQKAGPQ
jgi:hypothetical protein